MLVISTAICLGIFLVGLVIGPRIWRNEWRWQAFRPHEVPAWWMYGGALWRGWLRLTVVAWLEVSLLGISLPLTRLESGPLRTAGLVAAFLAFAVLLLAVPIVLFNRPRFLVVPWLRHQPGAIAEWRGAQVPPTPPPGVGPR